MSKQWPLECATFKYWLAIRVHRRTREEFRRATRRTFVNNERNDGDDTATAAAQQPRIKIVRQLRRLNLQSINLM